jgi:hypothetical protein
MNYTVMAWWYYPLNLVSGEAEYISDQYIIYTHQEMAWNDTIFEISGGEVNRIIIKLLSNVHQRLSL